MARTLLRLKWWQWLVVLLWALSAIDPPVSLTVVLYALFIAYMGVLIGAETVRHAHRGYKEGAARTD